ncbi:hypothetical protein ACOBR2_00845 [Telmatobacter bradus]|uniref:hypothetical protein n=1 Tax=Telmatobacter bradus TaxID=474953 RepID=UPI003B42D50D
MDERSFEDLVVQAAEFSKSIRYFNAQNIAEESWRDLFAHDEAVVMAEILTTDSARMEAEFLPYLQSPPAAANYLLRFSLRIDHWYQRLLQGEDESAHVLSRQIRVVIEQKLKSAIQQVAVYLPVTERMIASSPAKSNPFSVFDPMWGLMLTGRHPASNSADAEAVLRVGLYSLVSAISYLKPITASQLALNLKGGNHNPALALFLAFARLLGKTQEKINTFTARHRDFYYSDVLHMTAKAQVPDSAFLVLKLDASRSSLLVPEGTTFSAGKAGGAVDLIYQSDAALQVTDALVQSVRTLHCPRDPQISPEVELDYVNGLRTAEILSAAPAESDVPTQSWPVFGADRPGTNMSLGSEASIGFAVASSALLLREGDRKIELTVSFRLPVGEANIKSPTFGQRFRHLILGYTHATRDEKKAFAQQAAKLGFTSKDLLGQGLDPKYIFNSVVGTCFNIAVTTASGWYAIKSYGVSIPSTSLPDHLYQLVFQITLGADAPALCPCSPQIHGNSFATNLPVLRFCLNPQATIYGYSLFQDLNVEEIDIESKVSDASRMVAWNQFGQLDPSKPFMPFGPLPNTNSYMIFGNYDCARMSLTYLSVNIEWGDLPYAPEGFGEYYRTYGKGYENDAFVGRLSVLRDGRWSPSQEENEAVVRLFYGSNGQSVSATRHLKMNILHWFKHIDLTLTEEQYRYDQKARGGFFRIDLAGPECAFGHRDYPLLLTTTLTENARASRFKRAARSLPPPPYTPLINRISFSYTAIANISLSTGNETSLFAEKAFLIHPFGVEAVARNKAWSFLPRIDFDGNLLIGFSASDRCGVLTLLFYLREDSASTLATAQEPVYWFYLTSDKWQLLDATRILSDTTDGFLTSGIVTLDLPADIDRNNTVMPSNLYWLRASAHRKFTSFCSLYTVRAQALTVTRKLTDQAPVVLPTALPPGSIKGPVNSIPGLRSVVQLRPSSGGQERETALQQRTRSAERLRHKVRAVTPWDYERLVLDAFPEVFKVKCFPAMTSKTGMLPQPGSVLVVVVPRQPQGCLSPIFDPLLDVITLKRIRDYLRLCSSPQVSIEVRNPAYERVLIRGIVRLKPEAMRQRGVWLDNLNQTLMEYISPWSKAGPTPRFGWSFQKDEVEAFIRKLHYVSSVTQFSMLHLTQDEKGLYRLDDTARPDLGSVQSGVDSMGCRKDLQRVSPLYPWSIAIPNATNIIEATGAVNDTELPPVVTGIGKLVIGNTFVVIRRDDGQT